MRQQGDEDSFAFRASTQACCFRRALFDVCAQFNIAFIFKTRWWLALLLSSSVQGFSLGATQ